MWPSEKLQGSSIANPKFGAGCCLSGKVQIPDIQEPPVLLKRLLTQTDVASNNFRKNIRKYNSALAMATMKATVPLFSVGGPQCQFADWLLSIGEGRTPRVEGIEATGDGKVIEIPSGIVFCVIFRTHRGTREGHP